MVAPNIDLRGLPELQKLLGAQLCEILKVVHPENVDRVVREWNKYVRIALVGIASVPPEIFIPQSAEPLPAPNFAPTYSASQSQPATRLHK